ncbi:histidine kinase osmosensor [Linnemannia zychae]|nr:histidine kinase osmosensor [Linnemannia zychae]
MTSATSSSPSALSTSTIPTTDSCTNNQSAPSAIGPTASLPENNLAVITDCPNATNAAQWFYKPYLQPSAISTTAMATFSPSESHHKMNKRNSCSLNSSALPLPNTPVSLYSNAVSVSRIQPPVSIGPSNDPVHGASIPRIRGEDLYSTYSTGVGAGGHAKRTAGPYSSQPTPPSLAGESFHLNPQPLLPIKDESIYHNPYRAPSHTNTRSFIPPVVPGYEFIGGSQAGNMGLMMGKRISDKVPVTGKLHQSRVLLQHEYRILKRLQIANARYDPTCSPPLKFNPQTTVNPSPTSEQESTPASTSTAESSRGGMTMDANTTPPISPPSADTAVNDSSEKDSQQQPRTSKCDAKPGAKQAVYETGSVETEKYFNRVVEDFIDLDRDDMSILILERLGPNLLSHTHHQFMGLDNLQDICDKDGNIEKYVGSPFRDVYTFLVFALKAACVLEALQSANIAHLAICPTALHWMPAEPKIGPWSPKSDVYSEPDGISNGSRAGHSTSGSEPNQSSKGPSTLYTLLDTMDINDTKLRLFDFTHSKILSHERARAPNNIVEWQIPGYMEYHLQFLAPEQTGRAEAWMDYRTDIYALGATLFSLLTMQYPYIGTDSVQILQGVLTRDLPSVSEFRPDMPPIVDAILRKMTQKIDSFELGVHDFSYQFVLPNGIFGRHSEQQLISAAIVQAASAYQQALNSDLADSDEDDCYDEFETGTNCEGNSSGVPSTPNPNDGEDLYIFEDDIVSLKCQLSSKIPLSSKTLLRKQKLFDRGSGKSMNRGSDSSDPVVRVIFVSGPLGVGKTMLIRRMSTVARNSGLFAGGVFEAGNSVPYSAILSCIQSVLQQLLTQKTDALASLVVAIRTAFEPDSGISIICDLVPELKYFFNGSDLPESKDVPLTHSVARFHALILKLIRVISTHFFMTWLIDDLQFADENSIDLLATLVNVNKRLPIVLIITHRDTIECLVKVKQILGGGNVAGARHPTGFSALGSIHSDSADSVRSGCDLMASMPTTGGGGGGDSIPSLPRMSLHRSSSGTSLIVRGGGGVRFVRLQNPSLETIQEFLAALLHRDKEDVIALAKALQQKSWLTIRQLVLELYRIQIIHFNCISREWDWEPCEETLNEVIRRLTGEEYAFLDRRFRALDCSTKKILICASICGPVFTIQDLQLLALAAYSWTTTEPISPSTGGEANHAEANISIGPNSGCKAMAGLQSAIREGILVYTSAPNELRFHHGIMRKVALNLLDSAEQTEKLHFEMAKILFNTPGQEFRIASHVLQSLNLIKKCLGARKTEYPPATDTTSESKAQSEKNEDNSSCFSENHLLTVLEEEGNKSSELDGRALRVILSLAGEKSQKSGAQDMALAFWNAAMTLLPKNCWDRALEKTPPNDCITDIRTSAITASSNRSGSSSIISGSDLHDIEMDDVSSSKSTRMSLKNDSRYIYSRQLPLHHEALKLHLQCIEAERWRENFEQAMKICEIVLENVTDPIDRARVYQHQIEMYVWAYSSPEKATSLTIKCLQELGMPEDTLFNPTEEEMKDIFDQTHKLLLKHMPELEADPPKICHDPKIAMMMEVMSVARLACDVSSGNQHVKFLFYMTVQQWGDHIAHAISALEETLTAVDLTCDRLFHTAGMIHVAVIKILLGRVHLNDLMTSTVDHLAKHIEFGPKSHGVEVMQGVLQLVKCLKGRTQSTTNPEQIFDDADYSESKAHTARQNKFTLNMVHNNSTYQLLKVVAAFIFGHYAYIEQATDVWHDDPKSIMNFEGSWIAHSTFTVVGLSLVNILRTEKDSKTRKRHQRRLLSIRDRMKMRAQKYATNHAAMYYLLEAEMADQRLCEEDDYLDDENDAFGTDIEMDDDEEYAAKCRIYNELSDSRRRGRGGKYIPHMKKVFLLYEKAIKYSTDGDFPLHKCFAYELAAKCHYRHGLVTSARCLMANSCKVYQNWGAKGKVQWFHRTYPEFFPSLPDDDPSGLARALFYRPTNENESSRHTIASNACPLAAVTTSSSSLKHAANNVNAIASACPLAAAAASTTSPWMTASPRSTTSPSNPANDVLNAAVGTAAAGSSLSSILQSGGSTCPSASSVPSGSASAATTGTTILSAPLYSLQNTWIGSPQSPEIENVDLDVIDFSSVIEAMQVIASEIDLELLLVKSLGVLNQSVAAKKCSVIISMDHELVLAASLGGDCGRCESVNPPMRLDQCSSLFQGVIRYVINTSAPCLVMNAKDDPRFCADEYLKQHTNLKTVLCSPILNKTGLVGVLYMEDFPERAFANKRLLVMNLLVQQLGISITNALLYQSVLQSGTKLNGLLENMPCGIALWDATAENCQYINSTWGDMTGYTTKQIMDSRWSILVHPDEFVGHGIAWKERVRAGESCQWEARYGLSDGSYRWGIVRMLPIKANTERANIIQWLTVTIDIDDQRRAVQLKSNFLANMSHELRTPFSGILGMLSLLKDSSGLSDEQFEFVDMAKASCEMLIRIVDDLLNFSKLEADKVTLEYIPLCFEEILGDVCDLLVPLASRKGLELIILLDNNLPVQMIGDPDRMKQILMNLIGNAIKFSTSGSVVIKYWHEIRKRESIPVKKTPQSVLDILAGKCRLDYFNAGGVEQLRRRVAVESDALHLGDEVSLHCSVTDQGIGMTAEEQKMLFVSFQQTDSGTTRKYGGTGLGLSICDQLIAHMNGKIDVKSEKGKGSTFTFTAKLTTMTDHDKAQHPAEAARIHECQIALEKRMNALAGKRILILSPNRLLREQLKQTIGENADYMEFDGVDLAIEARAIGVVCDSEEGCPQLADASSLHSGSEDEYNESNSAQASLPQTKRPCKSAKCASQRSQGQEQTQLDLQDSGIPLCQKGVNTPLIQQSQDAKATKSAQVQEQMNNDDEPSCKARINILEEEITTTQQFDFILVDHVLDSAELDCLHPSPRVAFVLLLAPTTETLRWILPPASEKRYDANMDGYENEQIDVGGRGRIRQSSEMDFAVRAMGRVHSAAYTSKVDHSSAVSAPVMEKIAICNGAKSLAAGCSGSRNASVSAAGLTRLPSQLFKRWKNGGSHQGHVRKVTSKSKGGHSFQVVRMIKPVRRMKLLQIMYNALMQHNHRLSHPEADIGSDEDDEGWPVPAKLTELETDDSSIGEETSTSSHLSSVYSSPTAAPSPIMEDDSVSPKVLKRKWSNAAVASDDKIDQNPDLANDGKSNTKSARLSHMSSISRSTAATISAAAMTATGAVATTARKGKNRARGRDMEYDNDVRKRARNNDALSMLLSPRQIKMCQGLNVLVAEDDFVSQKILEKQLAKLGMNVVIANNGQEAVNRWLASERGHYTIAIFDHHMPIMDGLAATRMIRSLEAERQREEDEKSKLGSDISDANTGSTEDNGSTSYSTNIKPQRRLPIVGLSADIQQATKEKCIKAGMDEYMTKPLLTQGLAILIQRYCCE